MLLWKQAVAELGQNLFQQELRHKRYNDEEFEITLSICEKGGREFVVYWGAYTHENLNGYIDKHLDEHCGMHLYEHLNNLLYELKTKIRSIG